MPDYEHFREVCEQNSKASATIIDDFILYYAAEKDGLDREFDKLINRFKHIYREFPQGFINRLKSQYIIHRVFRQNGLINRYLRHAAILRLEIAEQVFLEEQAESPWRFSFSEIASNPSPDFYEMEDVFTGNSFLLHSPSISKTLEEYPVSLWFNLISFNGSCWQSFGPVIYYKSFDADDIFFFATELNGDLETVDDMLNDLEANPIPYMMLTVGSGFPNIMHGNFETVNVAGEANTIITDTQSLKDEFRIEYVPHVFKFSHAKWSEPPHLTEAFYDENNDTLSVYGLTDQGYEQVVKILNKYGFSLPPIRSIRLHLPMLMTINKLLKKPLEINPYSHLFEIPASVKEKELESKLNQVLSIALPSINAGKQPDIEEIAKKVGLDPETARDLIQHSMERINKLKRNL
jgi:hypothetical protein